MYERFKHSSNPWLYAFVVAPVELLGTEVVPESRNALKTAEYDEEGQIIEGTQVYKTIEEYLSLPPRISNDGTKCLVLLNESLAPRMTGVTEADLEFWDANLKQYGLGSDVWLTIDEANSLADFKQEEEGM